MTQLQYRSLRSFYFFYFSLVGILIPYFPLYLQSLGFKPFDIGLVMAAWPLAKLITPVFWSQWADHLGKRLTFIQVGGVLCLFSFLPFFKIWGVWGFFTVMFLFSFFRMGVIPMVEAIAMECCETHKKEYGKIRYWGSIGFIVPAFLFGWLIDRFSVRVILTGMLVILVFQTITAFYFPRGSAHLTKEKRTLKIFVNKAVLSFLMICFLRTVSFGAYYGFFTIWMKSHGYSSTTVGFSWALAVVCEVFVMAHFSRLHRLFSLKKIIGFGDVLTVVRWLILAVTAWFPAILFAQTLHALTFAAFHVASVAYMYQHTPPHMRATGQAVYTSVSYGLGSFVGFCLFGYLKDIVSFDMLFLISAGIAALGIPFVRWFQEKPGAKVPIIGVMPDRP
ncbi:MAG: MFS transporter [Deltaproteobacteria bacterium]|nr:MFS transporter [Deltaproteobacteria bacterium]